MPDEEFLNEAANRESEALTIFLAGKAARTTVTLDEFIQAALVQGMSADALRETLEEDLRTGGRIFGEFRRSVKSTVNGSINRIRDTAQFAEVGVETDFRWAAVLVNTCPDCIRRHNMPPMEWEEWEAIGLPRTGATVCKENCKCMLIPAKDTELEPVIRTKKQ